MGKEEWIKWVMSKEGYTREFAEWLWSQDEQFITNCCGAKPKGNGDCDTSDFGVCPDCGDHCEYGDFLESGELAPERLVS